MRIKDILFQALAPRFKGVLWAKPEGNAVKLLINHNGEWKELAGGSSSGTSGSNAGCDCAYQVIIKSTPGNNTISYEVIKGDFNTAKSKLQAGEYVDFIVYAWGHSLINDITYIDKPTISLEITNLYIGIITLDSNNSIIDAVYWTEDGISTNPPANPGTGGDSGDDGLK